MIRGVTRREILAGGAAAAAGFGAVSAAAAGPASAADKAAATAGGKAGRAKDKRPNVLFVAVDDMNDWTGWQGGYPGVKTPNLDRLARLATGFTRAYTPAAACNAARAAILFGVEPFNSGIYRNASADWSDTALAKKRSIVRWFRDQGYETVGTGKTFHTGWRKPSLVPEHNDPDAWTQFEYLPQLFEGGGDELTWRGEGVTADKEDVGRAEWLVENVLAKTHDKPFFAALGVRKPHLPWILPQEWFDKYPVDSLVYPLGALDTEHSAISMNEDDRDLPQAARAFIRQHVEDHRKILNGRGWKSAIQAYLAAVSFADHAIGVALDGLLAGPNASNTIVCVWSDHGWQLGEKLAWRKFTLWERATRVPLLIGGAGLRSGLSDALISTIDLYPTLTELCGGEAPDHLDGVSFAAYLKGEAKEPRDHVLSTWCLDVDGDGDPSNDRHFAVRSRTHRLIAYGNGDRELYDHRTDPWEWRNLLFKGDAASASSASDLERRLPKSSVPEARAGQGVED